MLAHRDGYETWSLDAKALSSLEGWGAWCICRIMGRVVADECRHPTIDLSQELRARRLRWVGYVLRLDETHLVKGTQLARAEKFSGGSYPAGFVLAKAPAHASTGELIQLAVDRGGWCREVLWIHPSLVCHSSRLGKKQIAASVETKSKRLGRGVA